VVGLEPPDHGPVDLPESHPPREPSVREPVETGPRPVGAGDRKPQRSDRSAERGVAFGNRLAGKRFSAVRIDLGGLHFGCTDPPLRRRAAAERIRRRSAGPREGPATVVREPAPAAGPPQDSGRAGIRRLRREDVRRGRASVPRTIARPVRPGVRSRGGGLRGSRPRGDAKRRTVRPTNPRREAGEPNVPGRNASGRPRRTAGTRRKRSGSEKESVDSTSDGTAGRTRRRAWVRPEIGSKRRSIHRPRNGGRRGAEGLMERSLARQGHGAVPLRRSGGTFPGVVAEKGRRPTVFESRRRGGGTPPREALRRRFVSTTSHERTGAPPGAGR
jgi:hypothetical protein